MKALLCSLTAVLGLLVAPAGAAPADASPTWADQAYAQALKLLHDGRRADAYGRVIALANAGHAEAARLAVSMCRNGRQLYGSDWDCAVTELEEWSRLAVEPAAAPPAPVDRRLQTRRRD